MKKADELAEFLKNSPSTHKEMLEKSGLSKGTLASILWKDKGKRFHKNNEGKWMVVGGTYK